MSEEEKTTEPAETEPAPETPSPLDELKTRLEEAQKSADGFRDQLLRKAAEFENYKKRTDAEYGAIIRNATESLLSALIPVAEDFARSLKAGRENGERDAFARGVELIEAKFTKVLEQQGLVPFDSVGKPFDVNFHDALLQIPRADLPPGTVIEEVERGYMLYDRVLRHAKVVVSAPVADDTGNGDNGRSDA
jgi:molecular chaperone GrpE